MLKCLREEIWINFKIMNQSIPTGILENLLFHPQFYIKRLDLVGSEVILLFFKNSIQNYF